MQSPSARPGSSTAEYQPDIRAHARRLQRRAVFALRLALEAMQRDAPQGRIGALIRCAGPVVA